MRPAGMVIQQAWWLKDKPPTFLSPSARFSADMVLGAQADVQTQPPASKGLALRSPSCFNWVEQ